MTAVLPMRTDRRPLGRRGQTTSGPGSLAAQTSVECSAREGFVGLSSPTQLVQARSDEARGESIARRAAAPGRPECGAGARRPKRRSEKAARSSSRSIADHKTGTPIERRTAFSTSRKSAGRIVPPRGPRARKDLSKVVICSHFAIEARGRPPSPAGIHTCVGAGRSVVESGTTSTSFARRFRTSIETTSAGRTFASRGWPGSRTQKTCPRRGA